MLQKINENQYDNASGLKKKGSSELTRLPTALDKCRHYHQAMGEPRNTKTHANVRG